MKASADATSAAQPPTTVAVELPITLGQFLKVAGFADTGGEAKGLIFSGQVTVNGRVESRRGCHLASGDVVQTAPGERAVVAGVEPGEGQSHHQQAPEQPQDAPPSQGSG